MGRELGAAYDASKKRPNNNGRNDLQTFRGE
jgi:hypothetical protein